jgi:hypothetical protein
LLEKQADPKLVVRANINCCFGDSLDFHLHRERVEFIRYIKQRLAVKVQKERERFDEDKARKKDLMRLNVKELKEELKTAEISSKNLRKRALQELVSDEREKTTEYHRRMDRVARSQKQTRHTQVEGRARSSVVKSKRNSTTVEGPTQKGWCLLC